MPPRVWYLGVMVGAACYAGRDATSDSQHHGSGGTTASGDGGANGEGVDTHAPGSTGPLGETGAADGDGPRPIVYATIGELFTQAMAPTCSPNVGVCHNSDAYPDLHTVAGLVAMIDQPCNSWVETHGQMHDFCEPRGDHLVFPELEIDVEIARAIGEPSDAEWGEISSVRLELVEELVALPAVDDRGVEVHRGEDVIAIGTGGASVMVVEPKAIVLDLGVATDSVRQFLDDRAYPWDELLLRVADPNGNGTVGDGAGVMIAPGDPLGSYLILRLFDDTYGDVMPRQCRTWSDEATRALGCFVAQLSADASVLEISDDDPIEYEGCDFDPIGLGICGPGDRVHDIVARSCGGSACHIGEDMPAGGLDLSEGAVYANLVDRPSTQRPERSLVVPGDADASWLMCKLRGSCEDRIGTQMPPPGAPDLAPEELEIIERWIEKGAPAEDE